MLGEKIVQDHHLYDIRDAAVVQEFKDKDGTPFMRASGEELRLLWGLSVDWFNPFSNKIAGRSVSEGSIVMCCLLLPPSLRYAAENVYLMGVIPGPREPSKEEVNHFLRPLVDKMLSSWERGTWYTRTFKYPHGRCSRSALVLIITDLPGGRKVAGSASHSATCFCALCYQKKQDINNINVSDWTARSREDVLRFAREWRDAQNKTQQGKLFHKHGVRWSELLRLPYWDPTRSVIVDSMHNLFLGVVQYHVRTIVGMDIPAENRYIHNTDEMDEDDAEGDNNMDDLTVIREAAKIEKLLSADPTAKKLERRGKPALRLVCQTRGVDQESWGATKKLRKRVMVDALMVSAWFLHAKTR